MLAMDAYFKKALDERVNIGLHRKLGVYDSLIDFSSNDYLGIASENKSGATGSRLISGNSKDLEELESSFAAKVGAQAALYYSAGYLANIGLLPTITDRFTTIISDELIHASLIDGIRLSYAKRYSFKHNDLEHLEKLLQSHNGKKIIVAETVYSMDGDSPELNQLFNIVSKYEDTYVILDEAHGLGLSGKHNLGIAQSYISHPNCLAIVYPLGKAVGLSGAFVVGSKLLRDYLINFSRSFIYSTGPSKPLIKQLKKQLEHLSLKDSKNLFLLKKHFLKGIDENYSVLSGEYGAIVSILTKEKSKDIEKELLDNNFFVKAILSPTVKKGFERLRICFHDYNTLEEIDNLLKILNSKN